MGINVAWMFWMGEQAWEKVCFGEWSVWSILLSDFGIKCIRVTANGEVGCGAMTEWTTCGHSVENETTGKQVKFWSKLDITIFAWFSSP